MDVARGGEEGMNHECLYICRILPSPILNLFTPMQVVCAQVSCLLLIQHNSYAESQG